MKKIEISLKEIVVSIFYHWKSILLLMIVVGGVGAGIAYSRQTHGEEYIRSLSAYDEMLRSADSIVDELSIQKGIDSALMVAIFGDKGVSRGSVTDMIIRINYNPVVTDIYKTANSYLSFFNDTDFNTVLSNTVEPQLKGANLSSLVSINDDSQGLLNTQDASLLSIRAIGVDTKSSDDIARAVYDYLVDFSERAGGSTLELIEARNTDLGNNPDMHSRLVSQFQRGIRDYDSRISVAEKEYKTLLRNRPNNLLNMIQIAAIGAGFAFIISIMTLFIYHLSRLPLVLPEQIQMHLGIRYLSGVRTKPGYMLGRVGDMIAGKHLIFPNLSIAMQFAEASLSNELSSTVNVLFTGTVSAKAALEAANAFGETISGEKTTIKAAGNICNSVEAMRLLSGSDVVILVESLRESKLREIYFSVSCINKAKKPIIGYVLI